MTLVKKHGQKGVQEADRYKGLQYPKYKPFFRLSQKLIAILMQNYQAVQAAQYPMIYSKVTFVFERFSFLRAQS